ncbi:MAG: hypothetical protein IPJ81_16295 [Chitinophagaceae bacterium]|nr:hypothetical protein [Chitinophagaceae bacterium]
MYTEVENELDPKKAGTIPSQIQSHRNTYAQQVAAEKERKRREAEQKAAKDKEAIDLRAECEKRLFNKYNDYLRDIKIKLQTAFNNITLETIDEVSTTLKGYHPALKVEALSNFNLGLYAAHHTADDIKTFTNEIIKLKHAEYANNYVTELSLYRDELIDLLPSKKSELEEKKRLAEEKKILEEKAKKDAEAKKRLEENEARQKKMEEEKKQREAENQKKIDTQAAESKATEETKIDVKKQGDATMVMFEKEVSTAELENGPEARQGFEITVLHPVGFTEIFAMWFEKEGKNLPIDKIGNTKLDQMKAWAEKYAFKTGTKIESKFIKYEESFKAVNRKAK